MSCQGQLKMLTGPLGCQFSLAVDTEHTEQTEQTEHTEHTEHNFHKMLTLTPLGGAV